MASGLAESGARQPQGVIAALKLERRPPRDAPFREP
jgi:hypothetical protein